MLPDEDEAIKGEGTLKLVGIFILLYCTGYEIPDHCVQAIVLFSSLRFQEEFQKIRLKNSSGNGNPKGSFLLKQQGNFMGANWGKQRGFSGGKRPHESSNSLLIGSLKANENTKVKDDFHRTPRCAEKEKTARESRRKS